MTHNDDLAPHRKALTLRIDQELYDALIEAGSLRGLSSNNEILETAVFEFIASSASNSGLLDQMRDRQAALQQVVSSRRVTA